MTAAPGADRVRVAVRVRPFSQREKDAGSECVVSMPSRTTTTLRDPRNPERTKTFTFDLAYWSHSGFQVGRDGVLTSADPSSEFAGQREVFRDLGKGVLDSAWQGYNATLLAYGQTGSGKSFSMIGFGANKGIVPSVCEELFQAIENREKNQEYQVTFSMLEIYNEQVRDLLSGAKKPGGLRVREDSELGFYVEGLKSVPCENYAQIERLMEQGMKMRTTASTNLNASSSRSHMVITLQFKQVFPDRGLTKQSSINLVDLAGSERQKSSGAGGDRLREGSRVNLSLTNLGNVISALADAAMGKRVLHVPYRDSVLTKLLQAALGGNSRTTLIAAISPADICYEETLSTLRYAERAKKVRNKAVVNTAALTPESRTGNSTLLPMLKTLPHLLNVNEDPQLTGVLKYFIQAGTHPDSLVPLPHPAPGACGPAPRIADKHASFTSLDGKVTVIPHGECKVVVNGVPITAETKLRHLDRIILGSNSAYLYIGLPSERGGEDLRQFDYDFFQLERAAAEGVSVDELGAGNGGAGRTDPGVLAVFQDYIELMPLVAEANQMSEELKKGLKMELKVKNLASSDSRGYDLQKEVMVKVTNQRTHEVWVWSKAKFINRKFLMEELYQRFLDGEDSHVAQEDDPFWDPVEAVHLGSAHVWLQPLAYRMELEEQVAFLGCDGREEAVLHVHVRPCSPTGRAWGEEDVVMDPLELLGKRMDFQVHIGRCLGTEWLKEDAERGVQLGYRIYDLPHALYTKPIWKIVNPQIEESVQFTSLNASQAFLSYLQTNALIVDLWGLQEGCAELSCSRQGLMVTGEGHIMVDTKDISAVMTTGQTLSNQTSELHLKLLKLEQETELLRNVNRALREENLFLRESSERTGSGQTAHEPSAALMVAGDTAQWPEGDRERAQQAGCDSEFAKALKGFYQRMTAATSQLLRLRRHEPPEDDQMLRPFVQRQSRMLQDFGDLLESSLWTLKTDVALIVKKKRERLLQSE
ncbi:kinesin-like protein KIF28P [Sturnira hondurensis]|uniref:kinesin-like protein KIF28P n=1 Tax=Sturnira hondurensis TaxID=192404 RepID=UPI00187A567E|nr:kinesin-like protein KIF28P [Sturnira hondurensis]